MSSSKKGQVLGGPIDPASFGLPDDDTLGSTLAPPTATAPAEPRRGAHSAQCCSTWAYPLAGLLFFLTTPSLWATIVCSICCGIVVTVVTLGLFFGLALTPQALALEAAFRAASHHASLTWLAWCLAVVLTLLESSVTTILIICTFFDSIQDKLFEKTLELRGALPSASARSSMPKIPVLSACCALCNSSPGDILLGVLFIVIDILLLPINLIPLIGTVLYLALSGMLYAWHLQRPWMRRFKRMTLREQWALFNSNHLTYMSFGFCAQLMNLVPLLNLLTLFTNYVAAALWFADLSLGLASMSGPLAPRLLGVEIPTELPAVATGQSAARRGSRSASPADKSSLTVNSYAPVGLADE